MTKATKFRQVKVAATDLKKFMGEKDSSALPQQDYYFANVETEEHKKYRSQRAALRRTQRRNRRANRK